MVVGWILVTHDGNGGLKSCDHRHGVGVKKGVTWARRVRARGVLQYILLGACVLAFWRFGVLRLLVALRFVRFGVLRPTAGVQAAFCAFWTWGHRNS